MSTYLTVEGEFTFPDKGKYEAAVALLQEGGWMNQAGYLLDEVGDRKSDEPDATPKLLTINFPYNLYRNVGSAIDAIMVGTTGLLVWTSTDGMFQGGVIRDGAEKTYDLEIWAKEHTSLPMPNVATDFDGYVEWQAEVEEEFMAAYL